MSKFTTSLGDISLLTQSKFGSIKRERYNEDLKHKLIYEWKNIYRTLIQRDSDLKGNSKLEDFQ